MNPSFELVITLSSSLVDSIRLLLTDGHWYEEAMFEVSVLHSAVELVSNANIVEKLANEYSSNISRNYNEILSCLCLIKKKLKIIEEDERFMHIQLKRVTDLVNQIEYATIRLYQEER